MPDVSGFLPGLGVVLVAVVLVWFTLGTQRNLRKADRVMRWLQAGLPLIGPRTTLRWLGSSVAQLEIVDVRAPYRKAMVMLVLEPRDVGALWAFGRRRGRRDFLLARFDLVRAPRFRADLVNPRAWTAGDRRTGEAPFQRQHSWTDGSGNEIRIRDDGTEPALLRDYWDRLGRESGGAWRISVRPIAPNLEIHLLVPALELADARRLLTTVRELSEALTHHQA